MRIAFPVAPLSGPAKKAPLRPRVSFASCTQAAAAARSDSLACISQKLLIRAAFHFRPRQMPDTEVHLPVPEQILLRRRAARCRQGRDVRTQDAQRSDHHGRDRGPD